MNNRILFCIILIGMISISMATDALNGKHSLRIQVYDSNTGSNLLWGRDFGEIEFVDGNPAIDPTAIIREQYFGRDVVYAQLVVDGEEISSERIAVSMSGSLRREFEPMDAMEMGVQIGEPGNDVGIRSDRLVVGAGDPNEKMTVEGAVSIQEQDVPPGASTGFGKIFIDNTDNHLYYIDESGEITDLTVDANAIQSVSSSANHTGRMDHMRFIPGEATEITESATDDTIYIRYDVTCGGITPCSSAPSMPSPIDGPSLVCSGEPGTSYTVAPVTGATYYRWSLPSGSHIISGGGTNAIHVILGSIDGNVSVTAVNDCGESSARSMAVSINRPTSPGSISGDALVCQGATGVSYSIATVPDATDYNWTLPPGASLSSGSGTPTVAINFGTLGGDVCVRTVNSCGVSDPECLPVTTTRIPDIPGTITGSTNVCDGATGVSYSVDAVSEATSYNWTLPTGASITAGSGTRSISVDFGSASGDVSVSATSICGTSSPRTLAVTVTTAPPTPGSISGNIAVAPDAEDESYSISPVTGATSYLWTVTGDATIDGPATNTNVNIDFGSSTGTTVDICVSASNICGTSSDRCVTVSISPPSGSVIFNYTGAQQTWTVPGGVTSVDIDCRGAQGGGSNGGQGGISSGTLGVTPGEVLYIYVGEQPAGNPGGFNGGGDGAWQPGGGGASDVRQGGSSYSDRVIVAGGGGGEYGSYHGGAGGGNSGANAGWSNQGSSLLPYGGTQTSGGRYGGAFGEGGDGASYNAGGGGGGWYGGGSNPGTVQNCTGAGGSGYIGGVSGGSTSVGGNSGDGQVTISW